jgi:hypothetical protein
MAEPLPTPVTWTEVQIVSSVAGVVVLVVSAVVGWLWRQLGSVRKDLADHRVEVARDYVSKLDMGRIEKNVLDAIDAIARRLDSLLMRKND